jgi:hypothetical protein
MACSGIITATHTELPTFAPNEYFFKNHQREGEEQWECFARCVREVMCEVSGLGASDNQMEDKFKAVKEFKQV